MEDATKTIEILNDLIVINDDRIEGYEKADKEFEERGDTGPDRWFFSKFIKASQGYNRVLKAKIATLTTKMGDNNSFLGKIHLAWMAVRGIFISHDRRGLLKECAYGESAMEKAYQHTLNGKSLTADIREVLTTQQTELHEAHDEIKGLSDRTD
jgi:uncharacterized protein (TIGR02284 family)